MSENNTMTTSTRFAEILSILRKYHIQKGMDPVKFRMILEDLGPTFVKIGQIMSTRQDLFSQRYCKELMKLRSQVTPMLFDDVQKIIDETYNNQFYEYFLDIDKICLGSASIAQVHEATLQTGEKVVLKIQRPKIYEWMERDVGLLRKACKILNLSDTVSSVVDLNMVIDEFWTTAQQEMDFTNEAKFAKRFKHEFKNCKFIDAPKIYDEYTKRNILVMEYVDGIEINDNKQLDALGYDRKEIADKLAYNYLSQIIDNGFFHADPHSGNLRIRDDQIVWIDFGMMGLLENKDREIMKQAVRAIALKDTQKLVDCILILGDCKKEIDYTAFSNDMDRFVNQYLSVSYADIDVAKLVQDMFTICHQYSIALPKGVSMLARSMMTIEGTLTSLDPEMNTMKIALSHKADLTSINWEKEIKNTIQKSVDALSRSVDIPAQASDVLKMVQRGQVKINLNLMGSQAPLAKIDQMVNRIIVCVLIAALFVGSSLICTTNMRPQIKGIPALGFIGYCIALLMSIWLFLKMLFLHKKNKSY